MFQSTTSLPVSAAVFFPKSAKRFSAATVPFSAGVGFGPFCTAVSSYGVGVRNIRRAAGVSFRRRWTSRVRLFV